MLHKAARLGRLDAIRQFIHTSTAYGHPVRSLLSASRNKQGGLTD